MEVEEYNEFGEIIKRPPMTEVYERGMTSHQLHRIHETKDLFEGNCYLCQKDAKERQKRWDKENQ